jgi:hypothetical protein
MERPCPRFDRGGRYGRVLIKKVCNRIACDRYASGWGRYSAVATSSILSIAVVVLQFPHVRLHDYALYHVHLMAAKIRHGNRGSLKECCSHPHVIVTCPARVTIELQANLLPTTAEQPSSSVLSTSGFPTNSELPLNKTNTMLSNLLIHLCLAAVSFAAPVGEIHAYNAVGYGTGGSILGLIALVIDILLWSTYRTDKIHILNRSRTSPNNHQLNCSRASGHPLRSKQARHRLKDWD